MSQKFTLGTDTTFIFDGDYSGTVEIIDREKNKVVVNYYDLTSFVAEQRRKEMIKKIERMSSRELLTHFLQESRDREFL